jgi:hypothetical protein
MTRASLHAWLLAIALSGAACTIANDIDVCERAPAPESRLNETVRGFEIGAPGSMTSLPAGGVLAFHTTVELLAGEPASLLRATRIDDDGERSSPCPTVASVGTVYAAGTGNAALAYPTAAGAQVAASPSLGLVVFVRYLVGTDGEVLESALFATPFDSGGCPSSRADGSDPTFVLGDEGAGEQVLGPPSVVRLGDNRFAVAWVGGTVGGGNVRTVAKIRLVQTRSMVAPVLGPIVEIDDGWVTGVAMTRMGDGRLALAWQRYVHPALYRLLEIWTDELELAEGTERQLLEDIPSASEHFDDPRMTLAYDGGQLLAAWTSRLTAMPSRVTARFRGPNGEAFASADSREGLRFKPSDGGGTEEENPTAVALPDGGFVLAWEERGRDAGTSDRIRALAFDRDGARRFTNGVCGTAPFDLSTSRDRPLYEPSLAVRGDLVIASWTALDRANSLSEVRTRVVRAHDLFPVD